MPVAITSSVLIRRRSRAKSELELIKGHGNLRSSDVEKLGHLRDLEYLPRVTEVLEFKNQGPVNAFGLNGLVLAPSSNS